MARYLPWKNCRSTASTEHLWGKIGESWGSSIHGNGMTYRVILISIDSPLQTSKINDKAKTPFNRSNRSNFSRAEAWTPRDSLLGLALTWADAKLFLDQPFPNTKDSTLSSLYLPCTVQYSILVLDPIPSSKGNIDT